MKAQHPIQSSRTARRLASLGAAVALALGAVLTGCASQDSAPAASAKVVPTQLDISAAATLKAVFAEIVPPFEQAADVELVCNFAAAGVLQKQIEGGAPCDVFASASPKQVDALIAAGLISVETTATFAGNELVIIVPADNPAGIASPADLTKAARVVTGNPDTAVHGTKAREFLEGQGIWSGLEPRLVFAETAAQTVDYVARGEVDAALVFASEVLGNEAVQVVYTVPDAAIKPVRYVAAPVMGSTNPALAKRFVAYLLTPEVQAVFVKHGFRPAPTPAP